MQESVVEQLLLSHADVTPGMIVRGTVALVESFGALIQLAEGVRGLCPLQHMSEFERTTASAKFQVCHHDRGWDFQCIGCGEVYGFHMA